MFVFDKDLKIKKFGLTDEIQEALAIANDHGVTFKRIAAWIEKNL